MCVRETETDRERKREKESVCVRERKRVRDREGFLNPNEDVTLEVKPTHLTLRETGYEPNATLSPALTLWPPRVE